MSCNTRCFQPWSNLGHGTLQPADMFALVITRREAIWNENNSGVLVQYLWLWTSQINPASLYFLGPPCRRPGFLVVGPRYVDCSMRSVAAQCPKSIKSRAPNIALPGLILSFIVSLIALSWITFSICSVFINYFSTLLFPKCRFLFQCASTVQSWGK